MTRTIRSLFAGLLALFLTVGLTACGAGAGTDASKPLVVLADATPHTDILKKVDELGVLGDTKIEIKGIAGDIDVNQLTASGDVDANFFQHKPYLDTWLKQQGSEDLVSAATVHVEPLGLYSKKVKDLDAVPSGATIAIPSDPSNLVRALFLLQQAKLVTLDVKPTDKDLDFSQITEKNITANPKGLKFVQIDRPQLAATLDDAKVDLSVINGNYALEAGLKPKTDALTLETATDNPYANLLVVKADKKDDPRVTKLAEALQSKEIQDWITSNYQGSVLPAKQS
ncbi:D-methionine transport system substrate-binding protein [Luteococcus japonicus]|uniref:Lipoprotein n=1 Tax=Luteococcus japonicus TaxID=33984 RepID=A0A3N1ZUA1_9ACTN|nr:MetQ/NlpA family ABC transporter substrate-binding protein [Luteococcus japonicus]ROR53762.1 D-methionine transport system substrate-binding protein [Luteococcus japonicus]